MSESTSAVVRRAILAALFLGVVSVAVLAFLAPPIEAAPAGNCTYYSNGSYTTVVGQYGYDCCNNYIHWGVKTKFAQCGGCFSCTPPPR